MRAWWVGLALAAVTGCATPELELEPEDMVSLGDFRLGYNIVVANDVTQSPGSREATEEELTDAVRAAMETRVGRYDGDGLYHIGLRIEAYSLGQTGIPIVASPRSVMLIALNIWDDATQEKLNAEPVRITAYDTAAGPLVGTGFVRTREQQLAAVAYNAAAEVEDYLEANAPLWFGPKEDRERTSFTRDPATGRALGASDVDAPPEDTN